MQRHSVGRYDDDASPEGAQGLPPQRRVARRHLRELPREVLSGMRSATLARSGREFAAMAAQRQRREAQRWAAIQRARPAVPPEPDEQADEQADEVDAEPFGPPAQADPQMPAEVWQQQQQQQQQQQNFDAQLVVAPAVDAPPTDEIVRLLDQYAWAVRTPGAGALDRRLVRQLAPLLLLDVTVADPELDRQWTPAESLRFELWLRGLENWRAQPGLLVESAMAAELEPYFAAAPRVEATRSLLTHGWIAVPEIAEDLAAMMLGNAIRARNGAVVAIIIKELQSFVVDQWHLLYAARHSAAGPLDVLLNHGDTAALTLEQTNEVIEAAMRGVRETGELALIDVLLRHGFPIDDAVFVTLFRKARHSHAQLEFVLKLARRAPLQATHALLRELVGIKPTPEIVAFVPQMAQALRGLLSLSATTSDTRRTIDDWWAIVDVLLGDEVRGGESAAVATARVLVDLPPPYSTDVLVATMRRGIQRRNARIVELALQAGAPPDFEMVERAAQAGRPDIVQLLVPRVESVTPKELEQTARRSGGLVASALRMHAARRRRGVR